MPSNKYIKIKIDNQEVDFNADEDFPVTLSYKLEDPESFQKKKSSEAFDVKLPATPKNDQISNTFHNPGVEDMSLNDAFRSSRKAVIEANGYEILNGKAFLKEATHSDKPLSYTYNFYGNNADWIIDLQDTTLFDFLSHINFTFTKSYIISTWQYDGRDERMPFVFAPVRYGLPFEDMDLVFGDDTTLIKDYNMLPEYMRPSISPYWIIFWAFKSLGYRIQSDFFDTDYFRRAVMPWTWGNFLFSDGTRMDTLDFLAKSTEDTTIEHQSFTGDWDLSPVNDKYNGGFDNNGVYIYDAPNKTMKWTYSPELNYGVLDATFHIAVAVDATATANSDVELRVRWFLNGTQTADVELVNLNAPAVGRVDDSGLKEDWQTFRVRPSDIVSAKIYLHTFDSGLGRAYIKASVDAFELDYFKIPIGGTINFLNYEGLKKQKFLDFFSGIIDCFNLSLQTDSANKIVYIEPTHDYSLTADPNVKRKGYFNGDFLDWNAKQDLSKTSTISLFADYSRELIFKFKDDQNDGILKLVQDRNVNTVGCGKYVFPDRFKTDKTEQSNRFFSPTMHYNVQQWTGLGTDANEAPQIVCICPENVSNTSRDEAQNTFQPKLTWYKGIVTNVGWVFDGNPQDNYPYMFAVNYKLDGQNDPVFSYSDERIGIAPNSTIARGWLRRFFLQRMAIMRNGQYYDTYFKLNNNDITNWLHREHKIARGQRWELVEIKNYQPTKEESTQCSLRKWVPVSQEDNAAVFPSSDSVLGTQVSTSSFDLKYAPMLGLSSDIPTTE